MWNDIPCREGGQILRIIVGSAGKVAYIIYVQCVSVCVCVCVRACMYLCVCVYT